MLIARARLELATGSAVQNSVVNNYMEKMIRTADENDAIVRARSKV